MNVFYILYDVVYLYTVLRKDFLVVEIILGWGSGDVFLALQLSYCNFFNNTVDKIQK